MYCFIFVFFFPLVLSIYIFEFFSKKCQIRKLPNFASCQFQRKLFARGSSSPTSLPHFTLCTPTLYFSGFLILYYFILYSPVLQVLGIFMHMQYPTSCCLFSSLSLQCCSSPYLSILASLAHMYAYALAPTLAHAPASLRLHLRGPLPPLSPPFPSPPSPSLLLLFPLSHFTN